MIVMPLLSQLRMGTEKVRQLAQGLYSSSRRISGYATVCVTTKTHIKTSQLAKCVVLVPNQHTLTLAS